MKFVDHEDKLQSYIDFRSQHLPKLFIAVFITVSVGLFYLLWDSQQFYPLEKHFQVLKEIAQGPKTLEFYFNALEMKGILWPIIWHIIISLIAGLIAALLSINPWRQRPDKMTWLHLKEGVAVFDEAKAGVKSLRKKVGIWKKRGIRIYKGKGGSFRLPYSLEMKHIIALGSVGSGKTVAMMHSIQSIVGRGDKAVIYDYKGDMTQWLAGREDVSLLAFADARSVPWNIAMDIYSAELARELAQTIIKETSDPVWGNNARDVLSGVLEYFIITKPLAWGFKDVSDLLKEDGKFIAAKLRHIGHGSAKLIDKPDDDKGAGSILSTVRSGAWIFDILAKAWGNPKGGFSVRKWLRDEHPKSRIIILRNYPDTSAVSNWILYIIFNELFGEVLSLRESSERRVWAIIDELATLPSIPRLEECLVASRSKGFRFLCGIQNFSSMREKYRANVAQTIFSQFATRIICRVTDANTASSLAADMGGDRRVSRAEIKRVKALNDKGEQVMQWGVQWHERVEPTMLNSAIMNLPDPTETERVIAWLNVAGFPICKLEWDFIDTPVTAPVDVPALWKPDIEAMQRKAEGEEQRAIELREDLEPETPPEHDDFQDMDDLGDDFWDSLDEGNN